MAHFSAVVVPENITTSEDTIMQLSHTVFIAHPNEFHGNRKYVISFGDDRRSSYCSCLSHWRKFYGPNDGAVTLQVDIITKAKHALTKQII